MTAARWVSLIIGILLMPYKFEAKNPEAWDILGASYTGSISCRTDNHSACAGVSGKGR